MIKQFFTLSLIVFTTLTVVSQNKYTVSGYIKDAASGENIIGGNVYIKELYKGATTNTYGFYSLTITEGSYTLVVSYLGYKNFELPIELTKDIRLNIEIEEESILTDEIIITDEKTDKNTEDTQMGVVEMDIRQVKSLPAIFGEVDILKTLQLLPGIQSAGDGNTGFYVRGGGPDQNLILLDEAPIYNASHLFGFFSVFNSDAIKNVEMIKGGMPAQYGGRLASVLDITMKEGNSKKLQAEGGIGIISSRLTVQGPIKKDTISFIVSGRRTYAGELAQPFVSDSSKFKGSNYYFYDLNGKLNWKLSDKDKLYLSGYIGRDVFTFKNNDDGFNMKTPWGNSTASLRWNHLFSDKLFMNTTGIFSDYNFELQMEQDEFEFKLFSGIKDWHLKTDFNYYPSVRHTLKFGAYYIYHTFTPSSASAKSGEVEFDTGEIIRQYANDFAVYLSDEFDITENLKVTAGLRYSIFQQVGPFTRFAKDNFGNTADTIVYTRGENVKTYGGIEPRIALRYRLGKTSSLKSSFTQNYQYIHLASLSAVTLPTDIWVPSSSVVKPQLGRQYALGYFRNFKDNIFETSVEVYYKTMDNQVEYKEGSLPESSIGDNTDNSFTFGTGESYGAEFFIKKAYGKLNGWVGYTLSWTKRTFDEINSGETFFAKYDRRHDISVVAVYDISKRITIGTTFVYGTGNSITLPVARYIIEGRVVNEYGKRNDYRMNAYHRMDLSVTLNGKEKKKFQSSWNFSVFNVYGRYNPYFIYFDNEGDLFEGNLDLSAKQVSLFSVIPSVTWNFKFK